MGRRFIAFIGLINARDSRTEPRIFSKLDRPCLIEKLLVRRRLKLYLMDLLIANHLVNLSPKNGVGADLTRFHGRATVQWTSISFFPLWKKKWNPSMGLRR
jgi:hypothetical protein